jgi:DNA-binding SARP family transcriptional activator
MCGTHGDPPLHLLGRPWLARADGSRLPLGPERPAQVLAVLGLTQDWVGRDRLAAMFWPERAPGVARANLRKVLLGVRTLGLTGVEEGPAGLRWCVAADVQVFDDACRQGHVATAIELGQTTLMEGLAGRDAGQDFTAWLRSQRQALRERWRALVRRALHEAQAAPTAAPDAVLALAERLLQVDGADEEALAAALRAAHAVRRPDLAQSLWQRHRVPYAGAADAAPSAALRALAVNPQFDLNAAATSVAAICRRAGGLPLAVELAAAWVRMVPAADRPGHGHGLEHARRPRRRPCPVAACPPAERGTGGRGAAAVQPLQRRAEPFAGGRPGGRLAMGPRGGGRGAAHAV